MFKKYFLLIIIFAMQMVFAQQRVAILSTEDDGEPPLKFNELSVLTDKLRSIATKILVPKENYDIMTTQTIQSFLGSQKEVEKACNAADGCLASIGRSVEADYVGQARLNRFDKLFTIKMEFYNVKKGTLVGSFTDESSRDIKNLLSVIEKKAPEIFKEITTVRDLPAPVANKDSDIFIDTRDKKRYKTVKIGDKIWMAKNLNFSMKDSKCYDNKPINCDKYGQLYNWNAAQSACPIGWHLATSVDWGQLLDSVDKNSRGKETISRDSSVIIIKSQIAGKYLKAKSGWDDYKGKSGNGTDSYEFMSLPGGIYNNNGFNSMGSVGVWWISFTEATNPTDVFGLAMTSSEGSVSIGAQKTDLLSVRCVKN